MDNDTLIRCYPREYISSKGIYADQQGRCNWICELVVLYYISQPVHQMCRKRIQLTTLLNRLQVDSSEELRDKWDSCNNTGNEEFFWHYDALVIFPIPALVLHFLLLSKLLHICAVTTKQLQKALNRRIMDTRAAKGISARHTTS